AAHARAQSTASTPSAQRSRPSDSIFGLDFFGPPSAGSSVPAAGASGRPSNASAGSAGQSRPDLKQSILSLYATPRPQPQAAPVTAAATATPPPAAAQPMSPSQSLFDAVASPPPMQTAQPQPRKPDAFSGLVDSFSGLSLPGSASPQPATTTTVHRSSASPANAAQHRSSPSLASLSGLNMSTSGFASPKSSPAPPKVSSGAGASANPLSGACSRLGSSASSGSSIGSVVGAKHGGGSWVRMGRYE
ncbi:hypothetical protein KEM55_001748, partial [Ascosphaera atra]